MLVVEVKTADNRANVSDKSVKGREKLLQLRNFYYVCICKSCINDEDNSYYSNI